jgi:hypothetical protein
MRDDSREDSSIKETIEGSMSLLQICPHLPTPSPKMGRRRAKFKVPLPERERDLG